MGEEKEKQPGLAEYYKTIYPGCKGPQLKHFVTNSPMGILHPSGRAAPIHLEPSPSQGIFS